MNKQTENVETNRRNDVGSGDLVRRQWCVEKAIQWCKPGEDATADMIDSAALIERYITTGEHSRMIEMAALECAMNEAETHTKSVSMPKAKAVCDEIMQRVCAA
jgi:hypothetical protein